MMMGARAAVRQALPGPVVVGLRRLRRALATGVKAGQQSARLGRERVARLAWPPPRPTAPAGQLYLNLGSGEVSHPAFTNVDMLVARHIHHIRPVDDLRPFADESVDLIYVSHCLEHFSHRRRAEVLQEWRRVLKPGGVLRLGVPDFDVLVALYEAGGRDISLIEEMLMGGQTYPLNAHYAAFTRQSLTALLTAIGFREVREWRRGADELTSLPDCTGLVVPFGGREFHVSLNLEAVK